MFKSILCPVDFSAHSELALGHAIELAELTGGHVTILHVVDGLLDAAVAASGTRSTLTTQTQDEVRDLLARLTAKRPHGAEHIAISVVVGDAGEQVLTHARECDSDLIVMGTQGTGGAKRLVFGSTTARVLREAKVPVLAVPVP